MTQPGVNADHALPPTAAIWWAGGEARRPSQSQKARLLMTHLPYVNCKKKNAIRSIVKEGRRSPTLSANAQLDGISLLHPSLQAGRHRLCR